jgi:ABC-type dipeptide/oligopeptide/nickel transport system ATPase subunit
MSGLRVLIVGRSGCGKTTLTKEMLAQRPKGMPCMIYDINQEYQKEYPEPFEDFDVFLMKLSLDDTRHYYIIIEEATIFFNTQSNFQDMKNVLVRARHTGNIIHVNFHSFSSIPKGIYNLLDYVIVFKTNDNLDSVKGRFDNPKVLEAYKEAIASPDEHFHKTIKIY